MFPQVFGKYVLEREVGAGGMARVYLATLRGAGGFEKRLVVKQIRAELASDAAFVRRFVEEAKTAVELSHPNIVPVYELGVEQGVYYIAMELCEGVTLSEVLAHTGPLSAFEGAYVGVEICRALSYAHRRAGIVHRDVTPRNVLVDEEGAVRVIDFGIAAPAGDGSAGPCEVFGSPGHMPPEQLSGSELSPATDVFAIGALLIEAWTGQPPFRRNTSDEIAQAMAASLPALGALVPELIELERHLARCVALAASERPQAADDAARPLREFLKAADLGDVARRLGERVRAAREHTDALESAAPSESTGQVTPVAPETRTFAVRDELNVWTRPLAEQPSLPRLAGGDELESGPVTRRLSQPEARAGGRNGSRLALALALALFAAVALVSLGFAFRPSRAPVSPAAPAPVPVPAPVTVPPLVTPGLVSAALVTSSAPLLTANAPRAPERSAILRLTADPPAQVSVDGEGVHERLPTPVRGLSLRPGSYRVTFTNETYGPPVSVSVKLASGAQRNVHADFREAEPRVIVR